MKKPTRIHGRTAPKIQLCPTCGRMRVFHERGLYACPVPYEVTERLREFARENGRTWKARLRHLWTVGQDEGLLRQARNMIGPTRIGKIKL